MTFSEDIRWRAIMLYNYQGVEFETISFYLGASVTSIKRWNLNYSNYGDVKSASTRHRHQRWPSDIISYVEEYIKENPCFLFAELQQELIAKFPNQPNFSTSTICRAIKFDLKLTRKVLTKKAREATPIERRMFYERLKPFYHSPEQLVFVDETSKDARSACRKYAWSRKGTPAVVDFSNDRGIRVSALASFGSAGFMSAAFTENTFSRRKFHKAFVKTVLPLLNPYPLPRSIVIIDNAKIHMYREFEEAVHSKGAMLFFLPPYSPDMNPIEYGFSQVKRYIQKHYNMAFRICPKEILAATFKAVSKNRSSMSTIAHCGYFQEGELRNFEYDFQ